MIEDLPLLAYLARGVEGDGGVTNFIKFYRRRPHAPAAACATPPKAGERSRFVADLRAGAGDRGREGGECWEGEEWRKPPPPRGEPLAPDGFRARYGVEDVRPLDEVIERG